VIFKSKEGSREKPWERRVSRVHSRRSRWIPPVSRALDSSLKLSTPPMCAQPAWIRALQRQKNCDVFFENFCAGCTAASSLPCVPITAHRPGSRWSPLSSYFWRNRHPLCLSPLPPRSASTLAELLSYLRLHSSSFRSSETREPGKSHEVPESDVRQRL